MRNSTFGSPPRGGHPSTHLLGVGTALLAGAFFLLHAQPPASPVLVAMNAELARTQAKLKSQPIPPYYLSYEITETHSIRVSGEFGNLQDSDDYRYRQLDVDLRVGDYTLDNTREVRGDMPRPRGSGRSSRSSRLAPPPAQETGAWSATAGRPGGPAGRTGWTGRN